VVTSQLIRRTTAELIGTAFLVAAIVGSGIMAQRLSPHDTGLELLENDFATACALVAIILAIGPVSGAHLNPVITLVDRYFGGLTTTLAACYIAVQLAGGIVGSVAANLMFGLPAINLAHKSRGADLWLAEAVARSASYSLCSDWCARAAPRSLLSRSALTSAPRTSSLRQPALPIQR
jgi:arsenate reductase